MIRALIRAGITLLASAIGLVVAAVLLDGMTLDFSAFIVAVIIYTVVTLIAEPLFRTTTERKARALRSGSTLFATLVALIITDVLSSGLTITGLSTWVLATVIVWLAGMLAAWILPFFLLKRAVDDRRA
ncbi:MAG TPA: hypothetical protein VMI11_01480 [Actinomycetes bacterium]|nr:hypothetical protein [Actinomycetes bacterium]